MINIRGRQRPDIIHIQRPTKPARIERQFLDLRIGEVTMARQVSDKQSKRLRCDFDAFGFQHILHALLDVAGVVGKQLKACGELRRLCGCPQL